MPFKPNRSAYAGGESIRIMLLACCTLAGCLFINIERACCAEPQNAAADQAPAGFRSLFDGRTLHGWHSEPRIGVPAKPTVTKNPGSPSQPSKGPFSKAQQDTKPRWEVRDGAIVGGQDDLRMIKPETGESWGFGSWLMTDETFGDFELLMTARPDWPCDTGIYVRSTQLGQGFQVLLDHRGDDTLGVGGSIGFLYLRGIGGFRVNPFNFRWTVADGLPQDVQLVPSNPPQPSPEFATTSDDFRRAWRMNDWNTIRIRVVGNLPQITTWINDVKICECDTAAIKHADYDAAAVKNLLGPRGHIALEVHDGPPWRWGLGKVARWRECLY